MFNKTNTNQGNSAPNRASLISSQKGIGTVVKLPTKLATETANNSSLNQAIGYFIRLGLVKKATIFAIAIGTIPVLTIGAIAFGFVNKSVTKQITQSQQAEVTGLSDKVNRFMLGRYGDIQVISSLPFLANSQSGVSTLDKQAVLNRIVEVYKAYDSVAVFDRQGNLIVQSTGEPLDNQKDRTYFQNVLQKDTPIISKPEAAKNTGVVSIYLAAPVKETRTGQTIGVVQARMPVKSLEQVIKNYLGKGQQYHLLDASGKVLLSPQQALLGKEAKGEYSNLPKLLAAKKLDSFIEVPKTQKKQELVSYVPASTVDGLPDLNWQVLLSTDTATVFEPQRQLLWIFSIGTALTALIVGAIASRLAKVTTQPILNASAALAKLGQGKFNTRLEIEREDELGLLSANINLIAEQLQVLKEQELDVEGQSRNVAVIGSEDERQQNETLQLQLLQLLNDVEGAARGDLTVRADVTAGEIGTVADFFNSIVESLRDIVTQVQEAATHVNSAIGSNEGAIRHLAEEALTQAAEINHTLDAVDQMTQSMQAVAENAEKAAFVANHAAHTATKSEHAMDLTVQNILSLRETVGETAKKVKRLGESSQQISRVVSLINQIAIQTNLLAINAGIEAARAGEEGQGFAVVAEEVGELAVRSAAATQEIEQIVENIQRETSEVVQAMEIGTTQVVEGTRIVEEAKQSLGEILDVSCQIDFLVQSISTATASQVETSQSVSQLMKDIAAISQRTSDSSRQVSESLQQTVEISQQLQETVETFKVS
ncbi:methyl-accepting chemotaxis protein [Nostoc flagelliforme FACHB-838]|uniref:Methyl-accepting chemotaxis protein n=1 Tax=Nostoc flagelliforme FACHB-838 TaxID=2692904 RepID=A0ABR8DII2_9NOSO|nr:methyl-accepting chemotaxis protein [Nostoc flagelliforme]MBD2529322.1 methyl-accepting chemotaxis protein [Nostoc flagelliforme FACHB-838]